VKGSFKAKEEVSSDLKVSDVIVNMAGKAEKEGKKGPRRHPSCSVV
jgi:hypothetical protein